MYLVWGLFRVGPWGLVKAWMDAEGSAASKDVLD